MRKWMILALLGVATLAHGADVYRWVDEKGVVNYTTYPPPANIKNVEHRKLGSNRVQTSEAPYSLQQATKNFPLTLYANNECGEPCKAARAFLDKRGAPYAEKNPSLPQEFENFKKLTDGALQVPLLQVGQLKTLKGFQVTDWEAALDQAGYPSTGIPGTKPAAKPAEQPAPAK